MHVKTLAWIAVGVLALSLLIWLSRSAALRALLAPPPPKPAPIVFDNGSVRDQPASGVVPARPGKVLAPPGALRKCVRGDSTVYSNLTCPPGHKEMPVRQDGVTVVPGAAPRPGGPAAAAPAAAPEPTLRQRAIDRAVEQGSR